MDILVTSIIDLKKSQHNRPHQFIKYLSRKHNITVLSINDWWKGSQGNLESYSKDFDDIFKTIDYNYITNTKISPIIQEAFSMNKVKALLKQKKFDVHFNYNTLVSGHYAAQNLATVYDLADDLGAMIGESPQIPSMLRPMGEICGNIMVHRNIKVSNNVTLTTGDLKDRYKVPADKSEIISNGVDIHMFRNYGPKIKEELGFNGFIVGYVGVLREWVDFEPLFSILSELNSEINVVIVGKEGLFQENVELAKKYGLENRVKFTGMIPYSLVSKYISAMDVCLIPFKKGPISESAIPLKLFEYLACEKPVISTKLSGIEKIAHDKIFYASTKEELKNQITRLFEDPMMRYKMGSNGRKFVENNYDWSKISERLENLLLNL